MVVIEPEPECEASPAASRASPEATSSAGHSGDGDHAGGDSGEGDDELEESFEDALTEEELKERALKQANDTKEEGNNLFRSGEYDEALAKYEQALQIASDLPSSEELRSMCHGNRAVCFLKLGKYKETVNECTKALELNPSYIKALVRRGEAYEKLESYDEAITDMKKIIELDPLNDQARKNIRRLEPIAAEKREKMKEEMIAVLSVLLNQFYIGSFWDERRQLQSC